VNSRETVCATNRSRLRYQSDLTAEEWALIAPGISPAKRGGTKRTVDLREVVNGLMCILSTGCQALERIYHALHSSRALRRVPRTSRARGLAERRDHRQPERERRRKRGATIRKAATQVRRSKARSGTFSSTRMAC
jgi:transposase